jgi:hypothetical protein
MAKQTGLIEFEGTLGGINFYKRKGVPISRRSGGGFNGKDIKTKDSMVRVRENGSEFGRLSKAKSLIRRALWPVIGALKDGSLHGRMMTMMQLVKAKDLIAVRGQRSFWKGIEDPAAQIIFTEFLFTPSQSIESIFGGLPKVLEAGAVCDFSGLQVHSIAFKGAASAFVLQYFVVDFTTEEAQYKTKFSAPFLIEKSAIPEVIPPLTVDNLSSDYTCRMVFLSVQFQQKSGEQFYNLNEQGMLGLRCLGVV